MYFPWLSLLRNSEKTFTEDDISTFDGLLFEIYQRGYSERFNARVYRYFGLSIDEDRWVKALDALSQASVLKKNFELCHPEDGGTIKSFQSISDIRLGEPIVIDESDEEIYPSASDIYITYSLKKGIMPSTDQGSSEQPKKSQEGSTPPSERVSLADEARCRPDAVMADYLLSKRPSLLELLGAVRQSETAKNTKKKGDLLEDLAELLFDCPPLLSLKDRNKRTSSAEYDLIFRVTNYPETLFGKFSDLFPVECKNWAKKSTVTEISHFAMKMERLRSNVGLFLSKQGITGTSDFSRDAKDIVKDTWMRHNRMIIVLDLADIASVIEGDRNLYELLYEKYDEVRML